jgi:hypothetical protein
MDGIEFAREIRKADSVEDRVAWFGALLARESGNAVEVVGGSAIEVYLSSSIYVSQVIDLVGNIGQIEQVLERWKFRQIQGRSNRTYWTDDYVGLVDIVGSADHSGLSPRKVKTPYGEVLLSAPEPLIIRRLSRYLREGSGELFRQAVALGRLGNLDWAYLESEAKYEKVEEALRALRTATKPAPRQSRAPKTRPKRATTAPRK